MATIKSYTDLEQSRKLAEILPQESADMYYYTVNGDLYKTPNIIENGDDLYVDEKSIPCWSLAALLTILNFPSLTQNKENEWEVCVININNDDYIKKTASNPVDACVDMIIKLNELNLL